ncbi:MAG: SDR family oxidoreductase [Boseongicola sp. SB0676_bin_33]|uniref:SDR family oxidoreductase n=1 Tax=Boseongicola sp. SB0664_bin_43 TaxID=2604844 RepID=A0A6B0Y1G1_9RHOB|nr:SDR family oxidoreductase [Boseongicola sp. SB0664_bin_43]MYF88900.1 SDR family oxidoreductase [Boseongicola sp. SB0676_bin_33]MYK33071.1 SDR family oxidoreductase [Boseongicola sp. SB0670_bin_30]
MHWDEGFGQRPDRRLDGKVALVTGAGSAGPGFGTGRATALCMAREGAALVLFDNDREAVEKTRASIEVEGRQALITTGDVTRDEDAQVAVEAAVAEFGGLDILVNNVGIVVPGDATTTTPADWHSLLDVNLVGMVNMARHAVPAMAERSGGAVINVSSISPRRPYAATLYSVSKGAVDALTAAMAVDHGSQGVRVNGIAPGPLMTPRAAARQTEEQRAMRRAASPLGIEGSGFDVAWAAVYLASDEARYVTGTILTVDGGVSIQGHRYR